MIDDLIKLLEDWERLPLAFVTMAGPWLTPLIPAYFVAVAIQRYLAAPLIVALITGIVFLIAIFLLYHFMLFPEPLIEVTFNHHGVFFKRYKRTKRGIYLLQRKDGIFKIGKTTNLKQRLKALRLDYKQPFRVVKVWDVDNQDESEIMALSATKHLEFKEGLRRELRQGNETKIIELVDQVLQQ